jgi:mannose-6-phosphate isomerase-like protein (cupin superfamily)
MEEKMSEAEAAVSGRKVKTASGKNFTCGDVGSFAELRDYVLPTLDRVVRGKVFLKEPIGFTGMEISFTTIPAGKNTPFLHHHKQDEEAYIFIQGSGRMQVDDEVFDVMEGSVVRVAPDGKRAIGNDSDKPLVYICIQAKAGSLEQYTRSDGVIDPDPPKV